MRVVGQFDQTGPLPHCGGDSQPGSRQRKKRGAPELDTITRAKKSSKKTRIVAATTSVAGFVAAVTLFVSNVGTLHDAWCKNIGTFCATAPEAESWAKSDPVSVTSGGTSRNDSDVCKDHRALTCIRPSGDKKLQVETARFDVTDRSGAIYLDGKPTNNDPIGMNNIGWFLAPGRDTPREICVTVFARTSACETEVHLRGQLAVRETASH